MSIPTEHIPTQPQAAPPAPAPAPAPEPPVEEVEFTDAAQEAEFDQSPEAPAQQPEEERDVLDTLIPKKDPKVWVIGPEGMQRQYVQKPLSFIAKMQWFSLVGEALDKALSGPTGMSLNSLFSTPGTQGGQIRPEDLRDADSFVQAISKLLAAAPDFLVKSYCIWLNVPDYERDIITDLMKLPEDEGGLSDDQGIEIIEIFLDQNYDALASFFGERVSQLQARVQKLNEARESRRSKR